MIAKVCFYTYNVYPTQTINCLYTISKRDGQCGVCCKWQYKLTFCRIFVVEISKINDCIKSITVNAIVSLCKGHTAQSRIDVDYFMVTIRLCSVRCNRCRLIRYDCAQSRGCNVGLQNLHSLIIMPSSNDSVFHRVFNDVILLRSQAQCYCIMHIFFFVIFIYSMHVVRFVLCLLWRVFSAINSMVK